MQITLKKRKKLDFEKDDIATLRDAVNEEYMMFENLRKLELDNNNLNAFEFVKLILSAYDVTFKKRDYINLAQKVFNDKVVCYKNLSFSERKNAFDVSYFKARVLCPATFEIDRNESHSGEELKELIANKKVILFNLHVIVGNEYDHKKEGFKEYEGLPVTYENYEPYIPELADLLRIAINEERFKTDLESLIGEVKNDTEKLQQVMDNHIKELHEKATNLIVERDKTISDLDSLNNLARILEKR